MRTLVIPYLFWSLLGFLFMFLLQSLPPLKNFFNQKFIIHFSIIEVIDTILLHPIPYQFWFVLHLCILILCVPFIQIALHYLGGWFIAIAAVFWFSNLNLPYWRLLRKTQNTMAHSGKNQLHLVSNNKLASFSNTKNHACLQRLCNTFYGGFNA